MTIFRFGDRLVEAETPVISIGPCRRVESPQLIAVRWVGRQAVITAETLARIQPLWHGRRLFVGPFLAEVVDYEPARKLVLVRKILPKWNESVTRKAAQS